MQRFESLQRNVKKDYQKNTLYQESIQMRNIYMNSIAIPKLDKELFKFKVPQKNLQRQLRTASNSVNPSGIHNQTEQLGKRFDIIYSNKQSKLHDQRLIPHTKNIINNNLMDALSIFKLPTITKQDIRVPKYIQEEDLYNLIL